MCPPRARHVATQAQRGFRKLIELVVHSPIAASELCNPRCFGFDGSCLLRSLCLTVRVLAFKVLDSFGVAVVVVVVLVAVVVMARCSIAIGSNLPKSRQFRTL
jgi:hypothetical protein